MCGASVLDLKNGTTDVSSIIAYSAYLAPIKAIKVSRSSGSESHHRDMFVARRSGRSLLDVQFTGNWAAAILGRVSIRGSRGVISTQQASVRSQKEPHFFLHELDHFGPPVGFESMAMLFTVCGLCGIASISGWLPRTGYSLLCLLMDL
jgi:hypothetical protein